MFRTMVMRRSAPTSRGASRHAHHGAVVDAVVPLRRRENEAPHDSRAQRARRTGRSLIEQPLHDRAGPGEIHLTGIALLERCDDLAHVAHANGAGGAIAASAAAVTA